MRFFHLSDLHIGKHLHHYNLKIDQQHILGEIVAYAKETHPDAIVIAGDIYDKSVPSAEAVTIFDDFLTELSAIEPEIPAVRKWNFIKISYSYGGKCTSYKGRISEKSKH